MWNSVRMFLWMTFLTGIAYPLLVTGIAQVTMWQKANGSLIYSNGYAIGTPLIAQKFESATYFWPRPSAIDYQPLPSGGSNFGPTSKALKKAVMERQNKILLLQPGDKHSIPSELLFASGSGIDPHIALSSAYFQMTRIAKARSAEVTSIKNLIDQFEIKRLAGLGESYVNVFMLNHALDESLEK